MTTTTTRLTTTDTRPTIALVSPDLATEWLENFNTENRNIRQVHVEMLAREITEGRWVQTFDPIKFDVRGVLIDGQHRLAAVVKSGQTVPLFVARNLPTYARDVIDTGIARTAGDTLTFGGSTNAYNLAAVIRIAISRNLGFYVYGVDTRRLPKISNSEVAAFLTDHPDLSESVNRNLSASRTISASPISAFLYAMWELEKLDFDGATTFRETMAMAQTNGLGDPRLALIRFCQNRREVRARTNVSSMLWATFRAWNAWKKDETLARIQIGGGSTSAATSLVPVPVA